MSKKILFLDSNVYIACIFQEKDSLNKKPLEEILSFLEKGEIELLMPKLIEEEVLKDLEKNELAVKGTIEAYFNSQPKKNTPLISDALQNAKDRSLKKISSIRKEGEKLFKKIVKHKNTKKISLTDKILLRGIKRSLFKIAPGDSNAGEKNKTNHMIDSDCIIFESLLSLGNKKYKKKDILFCANDGDYFENKENITPKKVSNKELKKMFNKVNYYTNPIKLLKSLEPKKYTKKDVKRYEENNGILGIVNLTTPENSMILGDTHSPFLDKDFHGIQALKNADITKYDIYQDQERHEKMGYITNLNNYCKYCGHKIDNSSQLVCPKCQNIIN